MRQTKWLVIGLGFALTACSGAKKDPTGGGDAQAGAGGTEAGGSPLDALGALDTPSSLPVDATGDAPSVTSGCSSSLECSGRADNLKLCSLPTRECVECLSNSDCALGPDASVPGKECVKNVCVSHAACINTYSCPTGTVCDRASGTCVQCAANTDCTVDQICASGTCRKRCTSDLECSPLHLLCETKLGYCAACVLDVDCPASQFCSQGECLRDLCTPGTTQCQNNAVVTCNAGGSGWVSPVACKSTQSCRDTGSAGICTDRVCTPSAKTCSTEGEKVVSCSADGLTSTVLEDCAAAAKVCAGGVCADRVCPAGAKFCQGVEIRQCGAKGESSTLSSTCSASQYCDAATTTCKAKVCMPNQPACSGTLATTCDAVGAATLPGGTDCAAQGLLCSQGNCQSYVCAASSVYCDTGTVRQCSSDGLSSTLVTTCTGSQYCDKGACKTQVCQPNQPVCNGKVVTSCNADGSAILPGGTDCSLTNQGCVAGVCKAQVCAPNTYTCSDKNAVMYCASDGLSSSLVTTCTSSQYCDGGTCKVQACTPNLPACNNKIATTCNATGSGYAVGGTDCSLTNQTCVSGACKDAACTPNTFFCKYNAIYHCDSAGIPSTAFATCASGTYCDAVNLTCKTNLCTPGAPACNKNVATTCNADGSGYEDGGTTCAATQTCVSGVCTNHICTPKSYFCQSNAVKYCADDGMTSSVSTACNNSYQYCDSTSTTCKQRACTPNRTDCAGSNMAGTCNADGSGLEAGATDCAALGKVCQGGACADTAVDTIDLSAASETSASSTLATKLNFYSVTSTRTLTEIEQYLTTRIAGTTGVTLNWVVYTGSSKNDLFERTIVATTTVTSTASQYRSSGPIEFVLEAGKYYAIGVYWTGASVTYLYHSSTSIPLFTSFGTMENGGSTASSDVLPYPASANVYYPQRLTTAPYTAP